MNPPDIAKLLARKDELGTLLGRFEFWLLLFGILVVVGVAGESYFGIRSWWNNRKLHEIARQIDQYRQAETAEMNRQAGEAFKQAGEANERAGKLEKEASELTAKNLELEAAIAPRRLSGRQEKTLASLTQFANRTVGVKSYSSDTEGLILATQVIDALRKSNIHTEDNRLTMVPAGSVIFGVSVEGPDAALVAELKKVLSMDGNLMAVSSIPSPNRGFSTSVSVGVVSRGVPPAATVIVGAKPTK